MTTVKVREAHGLLLNWLVAKALGLHPQLQGISVVTLHEDGSVDETGARYRRLHDYSDPQQAWPLIDDKKIGLNYVESIKRWYAQDIYGVFIDTDATAPLTAAMQMYVLLSLGEEVEVPDEVLAASPVLGSC